ncbi:MAG: hypothetical protein PHH49_08490, partial [Candidatus Omnitrophica bacterium]|nr:hypothetical protein [Candidatus Omnitrophota bacterium]
NTVSYDDLGRSIQTADISAGGSTYTQKSGVYLEDGGRVEFEWKLNSGDDNTLKFEVIDESDSSVVYEVEISGTQDWQKIVSDVLPTGTYALRWTYVKATDDPAITDHGWIDEINIYARSSNAMVCDGGNDYIYIDDVPEVSITGDQTISMWVNPEDLGTRRSPFYKAYGSEGAIAIETDGTISYYYGANGADGEPYQMFSSGTKIKAGEWTHIAVVRDLENMKLRWYINGELVNETDALFSQASDSSNRLYIGNGFSGCDDYKGSLDDLAMYSRALTAVEIADIAQNGAGEVTDGLVLHYTFDDGSPTNLSPVTVTTNTYGDMSYTAKTVKIFSDSCDYESAAVSYTALPEGYSTSSGVSAWQCQSGDVYGDMEGYAVQSGDTAGGAKSYMERTIDLEGDGILSFLWKLDSSANDKLKLYVDGQLKSTVTGSSAGWTLVEVAVTSGEHTIRWEYDRTLTSGAARNGALVDEIVVTYGDVLASQRADDYPYGTEISTMPEGFTTTGWVLQNAVSQDKPGFAAASNDIAAGQSTSMQKNITLASSGRVDFDWKISSAEGNTLTFQIINVGSGLVVQEVSIGGEQDWSRFTSQELAAGTYTIKWTYSKTAGASVYEDKGWVDNVSVMTKTYDGVLTCDSSKEYVKLVSTVNMNGNRTLAAWVDMPLPETGSWRTLFQAMGGTYHHIMVNANGELGVYNNGWYSSGYDLDNLSAGMHHIATTTTTSGTRFYVDGVFVGEIDLRVTSDLGVIGNHSGSGQNAGIMDDVAVFNRDLTDAEIMELVQNGISGFSSSDIELYYDFSDGTATDLSGKGRNGILCYGATVSPMFDQVSSEEFEPLVPYYDQASLPEGYDTNTDGRKWTVQNAVSVDEYGYAAASGLTAAGAVSFMSRTVSVTGDAVLKFKWKVDSAATDKLKVYVDGIEMDYISGDTDEWLVCTVGLDAGTHTIRWAYDRSATGSGAASANAWVDEIQVVYGDIEQDFTYSTFDPSLSYAISGYSTDGWTAQNIVYAGSSGCAAQTKDIQSGQSTYLSKSGVVLSDKGNIEFDWKLAAGDANVMRFEVIRESDSNVVYSIEISGEADWEKITSEILQTGTYTLRWTFTRNELSATQPDRGWVDNIRVLQNEDMCMDFDGSDDYIRRNNSSELQITGDQTIGFWIKADNFNTRQTPINKAYGGEGSISLETDGTLNYYYGTAGRDATPNQCVNSGVSLEAGEWAYVSVVRDLANMKIRWYINGELVKEEDAQYSSATASTSPFDIGRGFAGNFNGSMDEVVLYKDALSEAEINSIMASGPNVSDTNLVLYYSFNDGSATDQSLNALNGSFSNYPIQLYRQDTILDNDFDQEGEPVLTGELPSQYGESTWVIQNSVVPEGTDGFAAQASATAAGSTSSMSRSITLDGTATLSFKWRVDSASTDKLVLYVDGSPVGQISGGANGWQSWSSSLGAGTHTIRWEYNRTATSGASDDRAWVDEVKAVYADTIQNFSSALPTTNVPASGMWVSGDGYVFQEDNGYSDSSPAVYVLDDVSITNGTLKTRVNLGSSTSNRPLVFFRMQDDRNGYAVKLDNNYLRLYKVTDGTLSQIDAKYGIGSLSENTWYDIQITLSGSSIEYWVDMDADGIKDSNEYSTKTDTSFSTGKVGYGTSNWYSRTYFDEDITVNGTDYSVSDRLDSIARNAVVPVSGAWQIDGGAIKQTATSPDYNKALVNKAGLKDGYVSSSVKIDYSSSDYAYIYFRMDAALQSGYAVRVDGNESITLERFYSDGSSTTLVSKALSSYISGINMQSYHLIRVDLDGTMMTVFVDGVEIMSYSVAAYYDD